MPGGEFGEGADDVVVNVLGSLEVIVRGDRILLPPAQRRVLSILLAEIGREVSTEELIDRMWPDQPPATARTAVQVHVSGLRKAVPVESTPTGYRVTSNLITHDRIEFERLVGIADAARHDHRWADAQSAAAEASGLWRGDPYPDLADSAYAAGVNTRLRELALDAADIEIEALLALGQNDRAIHRLNELIDSHPFHDGLRHHLMLALYRSGRQGEALREYQAYRRLLGETMGIEPGEELRTLEEQILVHDPTLGARPEPTTPHNLAEVPTSFVGREADLRRLAKELDEATVVSLVGGPGVGKTRLAIELGRSRLDAFVGGVWFAGLSGAQTDRDVVATIGAATSAGDGILGVESLAGHLRTRPILLILDNCEHVLEAVRQFVTAIGGERGACRVLITSRQALSLHGESVHRLGPLPIAADGAVALLADRVRSLDRSFVVTTDNVDQLTDLCARLEGIPLAIELVARFIPTFGVGDIARLLDQVSAADVLEGAFRWSLGLLPPGDRELLHRLSTFEASFTLPRAHAVCALDEDSELTTAGSISRLVDASLLVLEWVNAAPRYRMLQPIRGLARRELDEPVREDLDGRLADVIADAAFAVRDATLDHRQGEAFATLDAEMADFRKALGVMRRRGAWIAMTTTLEALSRYWYARFLGWEATAWLDEIPVDLLPPEAQARVHSIAGFLSWAIHDYETADAHYQALADLGRAVGDRRVVADALYGRGLIHQKRRFLDGAAMLEEAAAIYEQLDGHELDLGQCLLFRGLDEAYTGDAAAGERLLVRARNLLEAAGYVRQVSKAERWLAHCRWRLGDEAGARRHADAAEQLARSIGDHIALGGALVEQATIAVTWGSEQEAADFLLEALRPIPTEDEIDICQVLIPCARLAVRTGDFDLVAEILSHIDTVYERQGWRPLDEIEGADLLRQAAGTLSTEADDIVERVAAALARIRSLGALSPATPDADAIRV